MIIIRMQGGLGNQLYQYALYKKFKSLGREVYLDDMSYRDKARYDEFRDNELRMLEVHFDKCTDRLRYMLCDDSRAFFARVRRKLFGTRSRIVEDREEYMPEILEMDDVYLAGFWQCEAYYTDILDELRSSIVFPIAYNDECDEILERIISDEYTSVSIHVRLTDYVTKSSTYGGICTGEYYEAAIQYIREHCENPRFYLFSDDMEKAKEFIGKYLDENEYETVDCNRGADSRFDMMLMSRCNHNICANSSFSMWGARLNGHKDKICIRPLRDNNAQKIDENEWKKQWPGWIMLDASGK